MLLKSGSTETLKMWRLKKTWNLLEIMATRKKFPIKSFDFVFLSLNKVFFSLKLVSKFPKFNWYTPAAAENKETKPFKQGFKF